MEKIKKYFTHEHLNYLLDKSKKCATLIFALATTIFTFISIDDLLDKWGHNSIMIKILFLLLLCLLSVIIGSISIYVTRKNPYKVFQKEKGSIQAQFGDMKNYITDNSGKKPYTVVIPINTHLNTVGDQTKIRTNSIHGIWLSHMEKYGYSGDQIKQKCLQQINVNARNICKIGDCCYFKNIKNVNYLVIATCEILNNPPRSSCNETQYLIGIQAMIDALAHHCDIQEEIFIPVIGGGYAYMERTNQELLRQMIELLVFNNKKLQHQVHVIVYEKLIGEIRLFALKD